MPVDLLAVLVKMSDSPYEASLHTQQNVPVEADLLRLNCAQFLSIKGSVQKEAAVGVYVSSACCCWWHGGPAH